MFRREKKIYIVDQCTKHDMQEIQQYINTIESLKQRNKKQAQDLTALYNQVFVLEEKVKSLEAAMANQAIGNTVNENVSEQNVTPTKKSTTRKKKVVGDEVKE